MKSLRLWHRRISLFLLIWVFFVALTGIGLNHSEEFGLDTIPLPAEILKTVYHLEPPAVESFYLQGHWMNLVGGQELYMDKHPVGYCDGLTGVAALENEIYASCVESVFVLNHEGEVIEQLNARFGLPTPIERFGSCNSLPCLARKNQTYVLDPANFSWQATTSEFHPSPTNQTPSALGKYLQQQNTPKDFNLERLIRDLHSGLFFGLGPWLMDLFAVVLMVLSITGFAMWCLTRRRENQSS